MSGSDNISAKGTGETVGSLPQVALEEGHVVAKIELIDKITETIYKILKGKDIEEISIPADLPDNEIRQLIRYMNDFVDEYKSFSDFMYSMARGELDYSPPKSKMVVAQSFKSLQSSLRHLTYVTQRIASGDFDHQVNFMGDFSTFFNQMTQQLKDAFEKIEKQNIELTNANEIIMIEKEKSEKLLLNILPLKVAVELKESGKSEPQLFENVTVFFSDFVGFTTVSSSIGPKQLISELNDIFTNFDEIMEAHECERIKTIGDAYLAVCGMPIPNRMHAHRLTGAACEIIQYLRRRNETAELKWRARIGIHSGSLVGGIVGVKKYIYDIFGDTINTAARMESSGEPMRINVSEATFRLVKDQFRFIERGEVEAKGKGKMNMYFLVGTDENRDQIRVQSWG
jgi:class 3 adenylate cyclase